MRQCLITFRSVTPAQRAEALLRRSGIPARIQRTPRWMEEQGCGYSLRVSCGQITQAAQLLRANQLSFRKIYLQTEGETLEEMTL